MEQVLLSKVVGCSAAITATSIFILSIFTFLGIGKDGEPKGRDRVSFKLYLALSLISSLPAFALWGFIDTNILSRGLIEISSTIGLNPVLMQIGFLILMGAVLVLSIINSFRLSYRIEDRNLDEGKARLV